jgi:hypothetical protein
MLPPAQTQRNCQLHYSPLFYRWSSSQRRDHTVFITASIENETICCVCVRARPQPKYFPLFVLRFWL